jgi:hypothetical protein
MISGADPKLELFAVVSAGRVAQGEGAVVIVGAEARDGWPDLHFGPSNNGLQQTWRSLRSHHAAETWYVGLTRDADVGGTCSVQGGGA